MTPQRRARDTLRARVAATFGALASARPVFYNRPGGLRFELSEGGSHLTQFLTALRKAGTICADIFDSRPSITVALAWYEWRDAPSPRKKLRALEAAGIPLPRERCTWRELEPQSETPGDPLELLHVAFICPVELLPNLLWCALGVDLGIRPCPLAHIFLMDLERGLIVHPYDDRGMDVAGRDRATLARLYRLHGHWLLDHDRAAMDASFASR
jgi:hypothetical protein